jgi:TnpA family transposase
MHLKASIETGAVVPSVILRKPAAAGAGNVLSRALRALGRIERTLFTLQGLSEADPAEDEKTLNTRLDAIIAAGAAEVARAVAHGGG